MLYAGTEHLDDDVWEVMKPTDFFQFTIPFEMPGDTKVWSVGLLLRLLCLLCWMHSMMYLVQIMEIIVSRLFTRQIWTESDIKVYWQWWRYTRARQVKWPGWKIHRPGSSPGSSLPSPVYCFASVIVWTENKNVTISDYVGGLCFEGEKRSSTFFEEKSASGWPSGGFSDLKITWLLYCTGAATVYWVRNNSA